MAVIGIDTATPTTAVACVRGHEVLHTARIDPREDGRPRHSEALLGEVERAAHSAGGWGDIELLCVGIGPGSFTGLRVGIATALGLARGSGAELTGVPSLDALAIGAERAGSAGTPRSTLAVLDARREELFAALYEPDGAGRPSWGPACLTPDALAARIAAAPGALAVGDGALRYRDALEAAGAEVPADRDPRHEIDPTRIARLGAERPRGPAVPLYLREPDAARWQRRDGVLRGVKGPPVDRGPA